MNHLSKAQKIVAKLIESPVETDDPETEVIPETEPAVAPSTPEREPDEKPNPFRRREIRPGQEPRPKACSESDSEDGEVDYQVEQEEDGTYLVADNSGNVVKDRLTLSQATRLFDKLNSRPKACESEAREVVDRLVEVSDPEGGYVIYGVIPKGADLDRRGVRDTLVSVLGISERDLDGPDAVQVQRVISGDKDMQFTVSLKRPLGKFRWSKHPDQWQATARLSPNKF